MAVLFCYSREDRVAADRMAASLLKKASKR